MKIVYRIFLIFIVLITIFAHNVIFASMADFTDEQADNKQKQEQQEWKKEQEERINKSSNNYLKSLTVKNYDITPTFDKQTIDYKIEKEVENKYIEILVETDDEKSSVSGTGKVELQSGENNLRIDVTAENGTVRTYFLNVTCIAKDAAQVDEKKDDEYSIGPKEDKIAQIQSEDAEKKLDYKKYGIIALAIIIVIIVVIIIIKKGNRTKKHGKRKH